MPSIATRGKDVTGDMIKPSVPPANENDDRPVRKRHYGWIQYARKGYGISEVYKNSAEVMGRKKG